MFDSVINILKERYNLIICNCFIKLNYYEL